MRLLVTLAGITTLFVLGSPWGAAQPGTGEEVVLADAYHPPTMSRAAEPTVTSAVSGRSATGGALAARYWVREYKRRWLLERRDGRLRARTIRSLRRQLDHRPSVTEAIRLASVVYRVDESMLRRKARCESNFYARARNRQSSASGVFQFLSSTWASTPFASFDVFSPYANALAAGWMHSAKVGRGNEWACR